MIKTKIILNMFNSHFGALIGGIGISLMLRGIFGMIGEGLSNMQIAFIGGGLLIVAFILTGYNVFKVFEKLK